MLRKLGMALAAVTLVGLALGTFLTGSSTTSDAGATSTTKFTKQVGAGSDSQTTAADTSTGIRLPKTTKTWYIFSNVDSTTWVYTQISENDTDYVTLDTDTVTSGTSELLASAYTHGEYANMYVRVIMDDTTGTASGHGISVLAWSED